MLNIYQKRYMDATRLVEFLNTVKKILNIL